MKPLIVITGPTASGKTEFAIETAHKRGCEIVNADSMQVYKYMDIGTAKPTVKERDGIPHYLFDEVEPTENYSVASYCEAAHKYISQIHERGKVPLLVGGTGLYIDSVVYNIKYGEGGASDELRESLGRLADEKGNEYIYEMLKKIDPESAEKIHLSDRKRIIRAIEVYRLTGQTMSEQRRRSRQEGRVYKAEIYAIDMEREKLYNRINDRVDKMFEAGLVKEVEHLLNMGVGKDATAMQAIGYKETARFLSGEILLDEAKQLIKQGTRRYAKRQLTWFNKNSEINWVRR